MQQNIQRNGIMYDVIILIYSSDKDLHLDLPHYSTPNLCIDTEKRQFMKS